MSAGRGGAGRGQGRKALAPTDSTERITITLLSSQLEQLSKENRSEAIRNMIISHLEKVNRQFVTLWEDNAGGLWLVDTDRQWAWNMGINGNMGNSFYADAGDLFTLEVTGWETENRHPYTEAVEQWPETTLVAECDGERVILYPDKMGYAAKRYCGII